jgi:hypothetical protein
MEPHRRSECRLEFYTTTPTGFFIEYGSIRRTRSGGWKGWCRPAWSPTHLRDRFERWWKTQSIEAIERHKLYKLAWDIVGTEFAGRHMLYEKFYAGHRRAQPERSRGAVGTLPRHGRSVAEQHRSARRR